MSWDAVGGVGRREEEGEGIKGEVEVGFGGERGTQVGLLERES